MAVKRIKDLTAVTNFTAGDKLPIDGATLRSITVENFFGGELLAIRAGGSGANKLWYYTGTATGALADFTAYGRSLVAAADEAAFKALVNLEVGTDVQAYDADLAAVAGLSSNGLIAKTGAGTAAVRTITPPAAGIGVSNGDGVAGNPTFGLLNDLAALEGLSGTGIAKRTGVDAWSVGGASASDLTNGTTGTGAVVLAGSPTFTGTPAATTASPSDNSTRIATTAYVDAQVAGSVSGVSSLNGKTGALVDYDAPDGRLTLTSGTPVMASSVSAATTLFYTPYAGNLIPIYDGTNMVPTVFAELSVATTDTTKNPAAIGASKVNDWFVWNDSGTLRLSHGPDWTNDTTRSAGTALTLVNGLLLNAVAITNGPGASRGTYVGTTRSDASSKLNFIFGAAGTGGVAAQLMVWNAYNRVNVSTKVVDNAAFTASSSTIQMFHNAAGAMYVDFVLGAQTDSVNYSFGSECALVGVSGAFVAVGFGQDSTTTVTGQRDRCSNPTTNTFAMGMKQSDTWLPPIGRHYVSLNQRSDGANASEFNNTVSAFLSASLWM